MTQELQNYVQAVLAGGLVGALIELLYRTGKQRKANARTVCMLQDQVSTLWATVDSMHVTEQHLNSRVDYWRRQAEEARKELKEAREIKAEPYAKQAQDNFFKPTAIVGGVGQSHYWMENPH